MLSSHLNVLESAVPAIQAREESCWERWAMESRALEGRCWLLSRQQPAAEQVRTSTEQWAKIFGLYQVLQLHISCPLSEGTASAG